MSDSVTPYASRFLSTVCRIAKSLDVDKLERLVQALADLRAGGGRLFFLGVGGGAGHASHAVCDFRKLGGFEAYTPADNISEWTARINDDGWDSALAGWLRASRLAAQDGLFVFSVGGGDRDAEVSVNLCEAIDLAKGVGATVFGIVGRNGGHTALRGDHVMVVPPMDRTGVTPHTESFQAILWHLIVSHPMIRVAEMKWESVDQHGS